MSNLVTRAVKGSALTHTEMDTNLKHASQTKAISYTVVEGDNRDSIDVTATATITLPDATTIAAASDTGDFQVTLNNTAANTLTVSCTTGTDTINGLTSDFVLTAIDSVTLKVNQAGNGYNVEAGGITSTGQVLTDPDINISGTGTIDDSVNSTSIDAIYDEDNMSSNDVNGLATQQSIKKYVDDQFPVLYTFGAVGSFALLFNITGGTKNAGDTFAGSNFRPSNAAGTVYASTTTSGTWRCMGYSTGSSGSAAVTLWQRIS